MRPRRILGVAVVSNIRRSPSKQRSGLRVAQFFLSQNPLKTLAEVRLQKLLPCATVKV
jgi:hypothetical protein